MRQKRRRALVEEALVRGAAPLGHEQELVGILPIGVDLDLCRQIVAGVLLLEHRQRRELRVAQVLLVVGALDAFGDGLLVTAVRHHEATLLAHDDRGAGILAHRQDTACGDVGVFQKVEGDETVVRRRLGIVQDLGELVEMAGAQEMVDVDHRLLGQQANRRAVDRQDLAAGKGLDADAVGRQLAVRRLVLGWLKHRLVVKTHRRL